MWVLVIVAVALYFAAKAGIPAAGRAIGEAWHNRGDNGRMWAEKRAARKQLTSDAVDSGMAPVSTKVGGVTGVATGAVITGSRLAVAAFLRACKEGWGEGKARAEAWQTGSRAADSVDEGDSNNPPSTERLCSECGENVRGTEGVRMSGLCAACTATRFADRKEEESGSDDDPVLRGGGCSCPDHAIACDNPPVAGSSLCAGCRRPAPEENTTTRGARPMPVESAVNGEIVTYDQFVASIDASLIEARSDREEAAIKVKTTEANLQITDQQAAALTKLNLPQEVVNAIKATRDSRAAKHRAAQEELKASELEITQLTIALNAATNNPQQQFYRG